MKRVAVIALMLLALIGAGALGALLWWGHQLETFARTPFGSDAEKIVEIPNGATMKQVARSLEKAGVIADNTRFYWLARRLKKDRQIKAGEYEFHGPLLPEKVLEVVALGKVRLYHCTIAEGLRSDEIALVVERCGLVKASDFMRLAKDPKFARQAGIDALSLEGYLYPDTYSFPRNPKPEAVVAKMVSRFIEEYRKAEGQRRSGISLDMHQTSTLASIIEKETGAPEERPRISCVFHNRLRRGMRLETDPTVIYAKILRYGSFDGNIRRDDLEFRHPYNTYTVKGLPPGPIANAGAAAIQAALNPIDCNDLFFVACGGGTHQFCPDLECHLKYVARCQLNRR